MRVRSYKHLGDPSPVNVESSFVLVEDDEGTPISIAVKMGRDIVVSHVQDSDFNQVLHAMGVNTVVVADSLNQKLVNPAELPKLA